MSEDLEKTNKLLNMAFEHINPIDFEEVIDGLRTEIKRRDAVIQMSEIWSSNWGLRRHIQGEIVVTNTDGSFILIKEDAERIAETLFYRMMDEILTGKPKEPCKNCDKCKNSVFLEDAWEES